MVDVFGMAGRTVFETCVWIGRFIEAWGAEDYTKVTRHEVKMHLLLHNYRDTTSAPAGCHELIQRRRRTRSTL